METLGYKEFINTRNEGMEPQRQAQVAEQLFILETALESLDKHLAEAINRCEPILRPTNTGPCDVEPDKELEVCELANRLRRYVAQVKTLDRGISDFIQRIEL